MIQEITPPKPQSRWKITLGGMVLALVTFCCGSIAGATIITIGSDATPAAQAITQIAVTELAVTQVDSALTYTPLPTYTSQPTYTPQPTSPPEVIFVTPTMPPDFTLVQDFSGQGKYTTDLFHLDTGTIRITWTFTGGGNFAFSLKRLDNDAEEYLENAIGSITGRKIMNVGASGEYVVDVAYGDGSWEITIEFMP